MGVECVYEIREGEHGRSDLGVRSPSRRNRVGSPAGARDKVGGGGVVGRA